VLRIQSEPSDVVAVRLRECIESSIPDARVQVETGGAGHFALAVVSESFAGKSRVAQQQLVYAAIAHLMKGDAAPVHAIDRLTTAVP
jgi:acid stress-induced BolA-like protein IbaG/YrbA